jgi:hypothetical protein
MACEKVDVLIVDAAVIVDKGGGVDVEVGVVMAFTERGGCSSFLDS